MGRKGCEGLQRLQMVQRVQTLRRAAEAAKAAKLAKPANLAKPAKGYVVKTTQQNCNSTFCLLRPPSNSRITMKSKCSYQGKPNAAAKVFELPQGATKIIAARMQGLFYENHTENSEIQPFFYTTPFNSRITKKSMFFIKENLMLPRRCLNSFKEPER